MNYVKMVDIETSHCIGEKGTRWDETLDTREKPRPRSLDILVANAFYGFHDNVLSCHQSTDISRMAYLLVSESKPSSKSIIGSRPLTWGPTQSEAFSIPNTDIIGRSSDFAEDLISGDMEINNNLTDTISANGGFYVNYTGSENSGAIFESDCKKNAEEMARTDWLHSAPASSLRCKANDEEKGDNDCEETVSKLDNSEKNSDEIDSHQSSRIRSLSVSEYCISKKQDSDKRSSLRSYSHSDLSASSSPLISHDCDVSNHCEIENTYPELKREKSLQNLSIALDFDQYTLAKDDQRIADSNEVANNDENCLSSDDNVFELTEKERCVSFKPLAQSGHNSNYVDNSTVISMKIPHLPDTVEIRREPKIVHCTFLPTSVTFIKHVDDSGIEECVAQCIEYIINKVEENLTSVPAPPNITQSIVSESSQANVVPTLANLATKVVGYTNAISCSSKTNDDTVSELAIPSVFSVPSLESLAAASAASKEESKSFENDRMVVSKMSHFVQTTSHTTACESTISKGEGINSSKKGTKPCRDPKFSDDLCLRIKKTLAEKEELKRKHKSMSDMYNEWYQKVVVNSIHQMGFEKKDRSPSHANENDVVLPETISTEISEEDVEDLFVIDVEERQEENSMIMPIHSYDISCAVDTGIIKHLEGLDVMGRENSPVEIEMQLEDMREDNVNEENLQSATGFQENLGESSSQQLLQKQNTTLLFDVIPTSPHLRSSHSALPDMRGLLMPVVVSSDSADEPDVFSEEIDMVLERPSMRRQDSFGDQKILPSASLTAIEFDMDLLTGGFMPTNTPTELADQTDENSCNEITERSNSESHSCRYGHCFGASSSTFTRPLSRDFPHSMDATVSKRDSALSRGSELSTASSDTVIASEEELLDRKDSRSSSCGESSQVNDAAICESVFTTIPGLDLVRKSRKSNGFVKGDKKYPHKKVESPLVTSEKKNQSRHCEEYNFACRQCQVDNKSDAQSDSTLMAAYGLRYSQESLEKASGPLENEDHQENYSLSSSSTSLFSKQSSQRAEEYDSQNCSSTCSSSPTSPSNSPRVNHHFLPDLLRKDFMRPEKEIIRAEREAAEACNWLKSAGFPQYASLYEVGLFPVSLNEVGKDHYFLDEDHIESLLRRLNVLNKCATMKLDKVHPDLQTDEEEDEDEQCAISENWHYEQLNHRWSRLAYKNDKVFSEVISDTNPPYYYQNTSDDDNRLSSSALSHFVVDRKASLPSSGGDASHESAHSGSNNGKPKKSSNFLKREFKKFRSSSFRRKDKDSVNRSSSNSAPQGGKKEQKFKAIVISEPQLQSGHEKLERLRCVPIVDALSSSSDALHAPNYQHFNNQRIRNRKNSAHSITSTSSSSAGGSSSAASTPATRAKNVIQQKYRARGHSIDEMSPDVLSPVLVHNQQYLSELAPSHHKQQNHSKNDNRVFFIPRSHTPGTFPSIMVDPMSPSTSPSMASASNEDVSSSSSSIHRFDSGYSLRSTQRSISDNSNRKRPVSIYDNIGKNQMNPAASAQDLLDILDPDSSNDALGYEDIQESVNGSDSFWSVDDIVEQTELLQQQIQNWEYDNDEKVNHRFPLDYDQSVDTVDSITNSSSDISNANSASVINLDSEQANYGNAIRDKSKDEFPFGHYSSTRRWQSVSSQPLQLHNLSAGQLMILRRLSVLKLTALMEKYASGNNAGNGGNKTTNLSWSIPRFIRRIKVFDYKDKSVFGVPLLHNFQRLGQPIPNCILNAMEFVRTTALDQVGLFRKPGVKSRIQKLREACELDPDMSSFHEWNAYDVADMVKQYFRDLPDPIMTAKLSDTFTGIFLYVPTEMRLEALCAAVMMLPDENTEALRTLLWFLSDVASYADENQMTESNLAVCFAPSLFFHAHSNANHNSSSRQLQAPSPRVRKSGKHGGMALGKPDMRDMNNNMASNQCLTFMIKYVKELFKIPEDAMTQCRLSVMQQTHDVLAAELGYHNNEGLGRSSPEKCAEILNDFHTYVDRITAQTIRDESRTGHNKLSGSGWTQIPSVQGSELCFKKVNDGNYLRLWRCRVEIEGVTIEQIMRRVMNERPLWDNQLLHCKVIDRPDNRSECLQVVRQSMTSHPNRDYCILRSWRTNQSARDLTVIVELSTDHPNAPPQDGVRGVALTSRYVIESSSSGVWASDSTSSTSSTGSNGSSMKCYLTHISRVDTKGRNPEWYNKAYGHIAMRQLLKIRESFRQQCSNAAMVYNNINNNNSNTNSNSRAT